MFAVYPGCLWTEYKRHKNVSAYVDLNDVATCVWKPWRLYNTNIWRRLKGNALSCPTHRLAFDGNPNRKWSLSLKSPCILRAYLIKAKSSVPAVNCYLWGTFFLLFFFPKLLAPFKSALTLEIEHNGLMNSHLWQILCKQPVNWICDQVFPYQGHVVLASVLFPFLSCRLSFTPSSTTELNALQWKRKIFFSTY